MERIGCLNHRICRAGDQVVGLEQPINIGFCYEVALFVGEPHGQFAQGELGLLQRQLDDLVMNGCRDAVPRPAGRRGPILQCRRIATEVAVLSAVQGSARDSTILILSSAEKCRRVARRISFTTG